MSFLSILELTDSYFFKHLPISFVKNKSAGLNVQYILIYSSDIFKEHHKIN